MTARTPMTGPTPALIAAEWLSVCPIYLAIESTGPDASDELTALAILDGDGTPLLDTLVQPARPIPPDVAARPGIDVAALARAPGYATLHDRLADLIHGRLCLSFDAAHSGRLIEQSARAARVYPHLLLIECVMGLYVRLRDDRGAAQDADRPPSLLAAARASGLTLPAEPHRATVRAALTRRLVHQIAGVPL